MNEFNYEKMKQMTHGEWDKLFVQMNSQQIQEMLMDKNIISILINEDVSKSYPSIASLFERAKQLCINDSSYELFTNGYVAELLDKRLNEQKAYGTWNYEEKKYELLCNLPENIKWILGTPKYVDIFSKVSNHTATSVGHFASQPARCGMYVLLSDTKQKLTQDITESEIALENLKSSLAGEKVNELADKLINAINEKKIKLDTINKNMEELAWKVKPELDKYGKLTHEEWENLFSQMNEDEVKEALMNSAMIVSLINEDVTKTYPSIRGLIYRAHDFGIEDEKYFELFTSGYVAELLNKRLSDENLEDPKLYERKKVELLTLLPVSVKMKIAAQSLSSETKDLLNLNSRIFAEELVDDNIIVYADEAPTVLDINEGVTPIEQTTTMLAEEATLSNELTEAGVKVDGITTVVEAPITEETRNLLNESAILLAEGPSNDTITAYADEVTPKVLDINEGVSPIEQTTTMPVSETLTPVAAETITINQNLDGYTMVENMINQNPNLTEEQRKEMRDALWSDFDKYVEQNPELNKQR